MQVLIFFLLNEFLLQILIYDVIYALLINLLLH